MITNNNDDLLKNSAEVKVILDRRAQMTINNEQYNNITMNNKHKDNKINDKYCAERNSSPSDSVDVISACPDVLLKTTCQEVRDVISSQRPLINDTSLVFLTLSLLTPKSDSSETINVNVDFRLTTTPRGVFNKLVFSLSSRMRDFRRTIQDKFSDWEDDQTYGGCLDFVSLLQDKYGPDLSIWIGKGRPRKTQHSGKEKAPLSDFLCMAVYTVDDVIKGRMWFENAIIDFVFDEAATARGVMARSTPIKTQETITNRVSMWM